MFCCLCNAATKCALRTAGLTPSTCVLLMQHDIRVKFLILNFLILMHFVIHHRINACDSVHDGSLVSLLVDHSSFKTRSFLSANRSVFALARFFDVHTCD